MHVAREASTEQSELSITCHYNKKNKWNIDTVWQHLDIRYSNIWANWFLFSETKKSTNELYVLFISIYNTHV